MARADLLCELIKYGLINDSTSFRKAAEALCAEERLKQHTVLANKIEELLRTSKYITPRESTSGTIMSRSGAAEQSLIIEKKPVKRLDHLIYCGHTDLNLVIRFS